MSYLDDVSQKRILAAEKSAKSKPSIAKITRIDTSDVNINLAPFNELRKEIIIVNESESNLYIKFGSNASKTSYSHLVQPNKTLKIDNYVGRIDGMLEDGTGNAQITEL